MFSLTPGPVHMLTQWMVEVITYFGKWMGQSVYIDMPISFHQKKSKMRS